MRWQLIDRLLPALGEKHIEGVHLASRAVDLYEHHFPERAVTPGNILLAAAAELAGWHEAWQSDFARWASLCAVEQGRWEQVVEPGDEVQIRLTRPDASATQRVWTGTCSVSDQVRAKLHFSTTPHSLAASMDPDVMRRGAIQRFGGPLPDPEATE